MFSFRKVKVFGVWCLCVYVQKGEEASGFLYMSVLCFGFYGYLYLLVPLSLDSHTPVIPL